MYLSLTKTKFQKRGGWDMKKSWLLGVLMLLAVLPVAAQQVNVFQSERVGGEPWR